MSQIKQGEESRLASLACCPDDMVPGKSFRRGKTPKACASEKSLHDMQEERRPSP